MPLIGAIARHIGRRLDDLDRALPGQTREKGLGLIGIAIDAGERQLLLGRQGLVAKEKDLEIGERAAQLGAQRLVGHVGEIDAMDRCADQGPDRLDLENLVAGELGVEKSHGFLPPAAALKAPAAASAAQIYRARNTPAPASARHSPPAGEKVNSIP